MVRDTLVRVGLAGAVLAVVACPGAATPAADDRFVPQHLIADEAPGISVNFDGTVRRVLPPRRVRNFVPLRNVPADPVLSFFIGFDPDGEQAAARLELLLVAADGTRTSLFQRQVNEAGWHAESIDLSAYDLEGARLLFVRNPVKAKGENVCMGCWGEPVLLPARPAKRPSVVLVSIDTVRADMLATHGARASTPALDALAAGGVSYTQAYSPSTWTFPSHYSLFRGVFPGFLPSGPGVTPGTPPAEGPIALAQILRERGYLTAGFTGGGFVSQYFQFADGFDVYYSFPKAHRPEEGCPADRFDGPETFRRAEEWLRANRRHPFFLFVHTYDAHDRCGFTDEQGRLRYLDAKRHDELVAHYRKGIEDSDRLLGGLLDTLAELELERDTLVVVTSDHGESLWEHGELGHGCDNKPYEELVRVPLVLRYPGRLDGGRKIDAPVSLVGVAPTILGILGLPVPASMQDAPRLPLDGAAAGDGAPVFAHCGNLLAVRSGRYKLITSRRGAFPPALYDLSRDPREKTPRSESAAVARMLKLADRYWEAYPQRSAPAPTAGAPDEATRERLRALGYGD